MSNPKTKDAPLDFARAIEADRAADLQAAIARWAGMNVLEEAHAIHRAKVEAARGLIPGEPPPPDSPPIRTQALAGTRRDLLLRDGDETADLEDATAKQEIRRALMAAGVEFADSGGSGAKTPRAPRTYPRAAETSASTSVETTQGSGSISGPSNAGSSAKP